MKKLFIITLVSFIGKISLSQPVFQKIFDFSIYDNMYDMIFTSDSSLLIYGGVASSSISNVVLIKTDLSGEIIWQKSFPCNATASDGKQIIESSTGFYYFTGSYFHMPLLMKVNRDGDTIWSKKWNANPDHPSNLTTIKQISANKLLLSCEVSNSLYGSPPNTFMMITDTLGNGYCSGGGIGGAVNQTRIKDNNYFVLAMDWEDYKIRINKNINCTIEDYVFSGSNYYPYDFEVDILNNIYFTSETYNSAITKINSDGVILWTNNLIPLETVCLHSILIDNNKLFTTGAIKVGPNNYQFLISICDTAGFVDTVYIDQTYPLQEGYKIIKVGNDLYISGILRIEEFPVINNDIFLSKYLSNSLTTSICSNKVVKNRSISLFPNPATSFITIQIQEGIPIEQAIIYNHLGQKVLETKPVNNTVDVSMLKSGIYFLEVVTKDWNEMMKWIKY